MRCPPTPMPPAPGAATTTSMSRPSFFRRCSTKFPRAFLKTLAFGDQGRYLGCRGQGHRQARKAARQYTRVPMRASRLSLAGLHWRRARRCLVDAAVSSSRRTSGIERNGAGHGEQQQAGHRRRDGKNGPAPAAKEQDVPWPSSATSAGAISPMPTAISVINAMAAPAGQRQPDHAPLLAAFDPRVRRD